MVVSERQTIAKLLADVAAGIRVLATRDGVALTEKQVAERARNIVAGLMGNYRILAHDDDDEEEVAHRPVPTPREAHRAPTKQGDAQSGESDSAVAHRPGPGSWVSS